MPIAVLERAALLYRSLLEAMFSSHQFTVIDPETHVSDDHIGGSGQCLKDHVTSVTVKHGIIGIISPDLILDLSSKTHPYCALSRHEWLTTAVNGLKMPGLALFKPGTSKS